MKFTVLVHIKACNKSLMNEELKEWLNDIDRSADSIVTFPNPCTL